MTSRRLAPAWRAWLGLSAMALAAITVAWRVFAQTPAPNPAPAATPTERAPVVRSWI